VRQGFRYLLCDDSGKSKPKSESKEWVPSPIQCLDKAVDGNPGIIAIRLGNTAAGEKDALLELCMVLKRNKLTRRKPILALLHDKHRGLIEDLERVGVDYVKFIPEIRLSSSRMIKIIDSLGADDRVEYKLEVLCPQLHYDSIDAEHEIKLCGAYLDRMVLGGKRLHEICETEKHLRCEYFLDPRVTS
jgi:hypothetical protein